MGKEVEKVLIAWEDVVTAMDGTELIDGEDV
jgi:hypothetical protein